MTREQLPLVFPEDIPQLIPVDDIYARAESLITILGEDRRVERKRAEYDPKALGEYYSMWANTAPDGGVIVIGIADDGKVTGCSKLDPKRLNAIESAGATYCPGARSESKRVAVKVGTRDDFVLVIRVLYRPDAVVRTTSNQAFRRDGDIKTELRNGALRELEIAKGQVEFEQEPCNLAYPEDFHMDSIRKWTTKVRAGMNWDLSHSEEEVLELRHLGRRGKSGFVPNNACVWLFARDPRRVFPGCRVRFLRFDGDKEGTGDRFNAVKDQWVEGRVADVIHGTEELIDSQLRTFSRLMPDGKFYTTPEYPKAAWYEAIVNAVAHRSYNLRSMHVTVKMFDDRLEVISPGAFPPLVSPENIYEVQHSRNPVLMDALHFMSFVKMANEGVRRMRDTMQDSKLPAPVFLQRKSDDSQVRVVLRNNVEQRRVWIDRDASHLVGQAVFASLADEERRAINFAAEHESINVSQLQRLTQQTWPAARKTLLSLVSKGILVRKGRTDDTSKRDPSARYTLGNRGSMETQPEDG